VSPARLPGLPAFCLAGQPLPTGPLPAQTTRVVARNVAGSAVLLSGPDPAGVLAEGTWAIEAWSADDQLLAEDLVTIGQHQGSRPVMGFVTSYDLASCDAVLSWLRALRCTVVQAYDWMASYSVPLPPGERWRDPLGRPVERASLTALAAGLASGGAVLQAYAPASAADPGWAAEHPQLRLYRNDGQPQRLGDLLEITNPASEAWQAHWITEYRRALAAIGFRSLHVDTYGYPRAAADLAGRSVRLPHAFEEFLRAVAAAFPAELVSFNQVNGVPAALPLSSPRRMRYVEVWPPNHSWRHLEGLIARSSTAAGDAVVLALYPPVWADDRAGALRTVLLSAAVATVLGASMLVFGDKEGALKDPYYPRYERLTAPEASATLEWHRFGLRHRDLFTGGLDTSWLDIGDENGAVTVRSSAPVAPEPAGGGLFARIVRSPSVLAVSILDLSGSAAGRWDQPSGPPSVPSATVTALLPDPAAWTAEVAAVGRHDGRFHRAAISMAGHREGQALRIEVPLDGGWAVARFKKTPGLYGA
jgi:dextranase